MIEFQLGLLWCGNKPVAQKHPVWFDRLAAANAISRGVRSRSVWLLRIRRCWELATLLTVFHQSGIPAANPEIQVNRFPGPGVLPVPKRIGVARRHGCPSCRQMTAPFCRIFAIMATKTCQRVTRARTCSDQQIRSKSGDPANADID